MSGLVRLRGLAGRIPTVLRTVRHLEGAQLRAQLRHALLGPPSRRHASGPPPTLAIRAPRTAFLPPPAHVRSLGGTRIELLATVYDFSGGIDWDLDRFGPLFAYHLHQHEYLRLEAWTPAMRARQLRDWIRLHERGIGWDPHPISLRLLCWGRLLTTPGALDADDALRDEMLRSMADQLETLSRGLEVRLQANHLLSNRIALVFGGLLLDGSASAAWRGQSDALLRELDAQIHPDGGHEERSPMYHALLLESLLDLLNLARADPARGPDGLVEGLTATVQRMLAALDFFTRPDGRIALFADSAFDVAAEPRRLRDYAERLGITADPQTGSSAVARLLPQTGYARIGVGPFDLIASVAGPAPAHQPGHAHCDALAFELSVAGDRLVTDTGLFEYVPGPRREWARSTSSHSTLQIDGREQAEIWAAHRVGGRPDVELTAWEASGSVEATCRGWTRGAPLHRRLCALDANEVRIVDRVEGPTREVRATLPIDPAWRVELGAHRALATRAATSQDPAHRVEIELPDAFEWTLERGAYYPTFGREIERPVLVGRASHCAEATTRFRRLD